jgi:hypothetical protein
MKRNTRDTYANRVYNPSQRKTSPLRLRVKSIENRVESVKAAVYNNKGTVKEVFFQKNDLSFIRAFKNQAIPAIIISA